MARIARESSITMARMCTSSSYDTLPAQHSTPSPLPLSPAAGERGWGEGIDSPTGSWTAGVPLPASLWSSTARILRSKWAIAKGFWMKLTSASLTRSG